MLHIKPWIDYGIGIGAARVRPIVLAMVTDPTLLSTDSRSIGDRRDPEVEDRNTEGCGG